jgi:hypothetical protein
MSGNLDSIQYFHVEKQSIDCWLANYLLFVVIGAGTTLLGKSSALHTTGLTTAVWGSKGIVDMLLRIDSNKKRWRVAEMLTNSDVSLTDEDTSVVDGLSKTALEDLSLKTSLEHLLASHGKGIIELSLILVKETHSDQLTHKSLTLELSGFVILFEGEQVTSSRSDLRKRVHDSPDLSLVLQTVFTDDSKLRVQTRLLVRSSGTLSGLGVVSIVLSH